MQQGQLGLLSGGRGLARLQIGDGVLAAAE
jgi:hypothetical protein